ncbi:MAG: serine--tRNA ligase [candidate division WOR-3 bacterium]|jgi:seryl-tRNA synthetase
MDLKFIRENPDEVRRVLALRRSPVSIDEILHLDRERRRLITERDELRREQKELSGLIARLKQNRQHDPELLNQARMLSERIKTLENRVQEIENRQAELVNLLPNRVHHSVTEEEEIVSTWGEPPQFNFQPLAHWDLGPALRLIDFEAAARLAGSRFVLFREQGAALERALINFFLDTAVQKYGYTEIAPPVLANAETLHAAGQLPNLKSEMYFLPEDQLFLIPTAEPQLVSYYRESTLAETELPVKLVAYTPCFRREAGSYGRDVRGMIRIHQFDKVELVRLTWPERSYQDLEEMRAEAESLLQLLCLPYRVKRLAAWDIAFQSAKTYDLEVWAAGVGRWLEVSSISNCEDFQTRRGKIRVRTQKGGSFYPHALNGSALALPRTFIALIENYQQPDGSVIVPEVLRPYLHGRERIG